MFGKLIGISGNKAEIALEDELDARRINTLAMVNSLQWISQSLMEDI